MVPDTVRRLLDEQDDMEVVGDCRGPMKILQETGRANADAVILIQEGEREPGICSQLLAAYPDLIIMSVTPDLTATRTFQLASHRRDFINMGLEDIVQRLREATRISH
jgi:DNA-binding NarL/FixJ family response regulator